MVIGSQVENNFISRLLNPDQVDYFGLDDQKQVEMVWIGATDYEDENSSIYDLDTNTSAVVDLNATEGDWKWMDGSDISTGPYQNWFNGVEPNATGSSSQDYAALDWSTDGGTWADVNATTGCPLSLNINW